MIERLLRLPPLNSSPLFSFAQWQVSYVFIGGDSNTHLRLFTPGTANQIAYADRLNGINGTSMLMSPPGSFQFQSWNHIAFTLVNATGVGTLYLNGAAVDSGVVTAFASRTWTETYFGRSLLPAEQQLMGARDAGSRCPLRAVLLVCPRVRSDLCRRRPGEVNFLSPVMHAIL